jgi:hypothetical protein
MTRTLIIIAALGALLISSSYAEEIASCHVINKGISFAPTTREECKSVGGSPRVWGLGCHGSQYKCVHNEEIDYCTCAQTSAPPSALDAVLPDSLPDMNREQFLRWIAR